MKTNTELDTKILNKNLEITKLTKQLDDLTSDNVNLLSLLTEIHERMYSMMEYCERLQPVELETDNPHTEDQYTSIVNITDEEEMMKTKLFRLVDKDEMTNFDDQTSRSILKDLRKVIKSLE
tara:strand:+ start:651 stop:1016 length:366 start_codon:yes stop_codon:yes gene_type:complete